MSDRYWKCQHGAKCMVPCPGCPGANPRALHNRMMVNRIKGVPAQPATDESDADPQNPNSNQ